MIIGKKGTMIDVFYLAIVFLFIGIMIVIGVYLKDQIFPMLTEFWGAESTAQQVTNTVQGGFGMLDYVFMFVFFSMSAVPLMMAAFVKNHPVFLIINLLLMFVYFLIAPSFSNVMQQFWSQPQLAIYAEGGGGSVTFPIMTRVFMYMPLISLMFSVILMIAQFAKGNEGGF